VIERIRRSKAPVKVVKTMCSDSYSRQRTAVELAQRADVVILLDDGGGAAQRVFEVCSRVNKRVHRVRSKQDIKPACVGGAGTAAIIGGILVPAWSVEDVAAYVRTFSQS